MSYIQINFIENLTLLLVAFLLILFSFQLVLFYVILNLKTLFCYLLDIYCNELKFIYPNDLVSKRLNSKKTHH